jgi:hypothetical protein
MKRILVLLLMTLLTRILYPNICYSQTYTTSSKSCGSCRGAVSASSKIGDICPHCGVRWGYENTTTSSRTIKKTKTNNYYQPQYNYNTENNSHINTKSPYNTVTNFLTFLGNQNFLSAYNLTNNKIWWSYESFSSINAYGGISEITIYKITNVSISNSDAIVKAYYEAIDPINGNGIYLQNFYLKKFNSGWKIIKTKLIKKS